MAKTILIVEDNELNMRLFTDLLRSQGHVTLQVRDSREVERTVKEQQPDLILMDIQLPEISGLDLTRRLKADDATRHIPVIAVTAFAMKADEERIREAGCDGYIAKPISVAGFLQTVNGFLAQA